MNASPAPPSSPFLSIPAGWRIALVSFLLLYEWLFPTAAAMGHLDADALFLPRVLLRLVWVLLLCWPLIFYRREYGFLHPLILPTLFGTLKVVAEFPVALFSPIHVPLFDFDVSSGSRAISIQTLSHQELAWTRLEYEGLQVLALACYYAGYFAFRRARADWIPFHPPRHLGPICFGATITCALVGFAFVQLHGGGLVSYLISMRHGRHSQLAGSGQYLQVARFAVLPTLVWFAYQRRPALNPMWLGAIVVGTLSAIITTGSRSAAIIPLAVLVLLWWRKAGRVLIVPSAALVLFAFVAIGAFGAIRHDYKSRTIDTSVLGISALGENVARAQSEITTRNADESDLAAFAGVRNGMLWGKSYVGAIAAFVPRALWHGKPFGGGAYNQAVNFAGLSIAQTATSKAYGIPLGPASEAYWNFNLPGVIIVFFLLGMFHRWLSTLVWRYATEPAALVLAVWIAVNFTGTSLSFVDTVRDVAMFGILFYALGVWRPRFAHRRLGYRPIPVPLATPRMDR